MHTIAAWISRHRANLITAVLLAAAYLASYLPVLRDSPQYAPDTRYYLAMALRYTGLSKQEAHDIVLEHSARSGWEGPPVESLFGWGLVQPRVVYPALSAPFVKLWGPDGMLVVPALALFAFVVLAVWAMRARYRSVLVLVPALLIIASPKLMFYGTAMLTESLTALWCALILFAVWRYQATSGRVWLIAAGLCTVGMAFTRQAALIPAGALVVAWLAALVLRDRPRRWFLPMVVVAGTAVVVQVVQTLVWPTFSQLTQFLHATGADNLQGAIRKTPALALKILRRDFEYYMVADHALLLLVVLSMIAGVVLWRRAESHLLLGAFLAISFLNITNGTPTAFRYAMPGLVFFVLAIAALLERATPDGFGSIPGPDAWRASSSDVSPLLAEHPRAHDHVVEGSDDDHRGELRDVSLDVDGDESSDQTRRERQVGADEYHVTP